jgi:hypothetical protein
MPCLKDKTTSIVFYSLRQLIDTKFGHFVVRMWSAKYFISRLSFPKTFYLIPPYLKIEIDANFLIIWLSNPQQRWYSSWKAKESSLIRVLYNENLSQDTNIIGIRNIYLMNTNSRKRSISKTPQCQLYVIKSNLFLVPTKKTYCHAKHMFIS